MLLFFSYLQGKHDNCHKDPRCQQDGYIPSKRIIESEAAAKALTNTIKGTSIYKYAEDFAEV